MGLTTNLVEALELACRRGVDSEAIVREEEWAVPGVEVGEKEGVEDIASNRGSSWDGAVGGYGDLEHGVVNSLGDEEVDRGVMDV